MKKYCLLLGALLGVMCWSCKNDKDKDNFSPSATITLSAPAAGASVDLATDQSVTFSWTPEGVTGEFTVKLSKSENLSDPQTLPATGNSLEVTAANLDDKLEALGVQGSEETIIYWAVSQNDLQSAARALKVKRIPLPPAASINLDAPADNATVDLSDSQDVIFSWTAEGVPGSSFTVTLSKSEDLSDPQTLAATDNPLTVTAADLDDKLAALGIDQGAAATIYWAVSQSDLQSDARALNVTRIPAVPVALTAPIANAAIALDYTTPGATIEFAWSGGSSAATYELVISKSANFAAGNILLTVPGITGNSKPFTHQELQESLINPDVLALKRYAPNNLYWKVKVNGEYVVETPGTFNLSGWPVFVDVRNNGAETKVYKVAVINHNGYSAVWLAEDLKARYALDGTDLFTTHHDGGTDYWTAYAGLARKRQDKIQNQDPSDGGWGGDYLGKAIPTYFTNLGTVYYRPQFDGTFNLETKLAPAGWKIPTEQDWTALFTAAAAYDGGEDNNGAFALRDPARYQPDQEGNSTYSFEWKPAPETWNAWKMNMGPNGKFIEGYSKYEYYKPADLNVAYEIFYVYNTPASNGKKYMEFFEWGQPGINFSDVPYTGDGLFPVRLMYTGR